MPEEKSKIDLSLLQITTPEIKELVSYLSFSADKKKFFEMLKSRRFERDTGYDRAKLLESIRNKIENNRFRELTKEDCSILYKYIVAILGKNFVDVFVRITENRLTKVLSTLKDVLIVRRVHKDVDEMLSSKINIFFEKLNKELLMKWVFFLDNLPSVSRDETEEAEVREYCERIIEWLTKTTVKEDHLKTSDWRILKNCIHFFGASAFFKQEAELPGSTYYGILPFSLDSLMLGLTKSTRRAFLRKSVEERLSLIRPPVINRDDLKSFLLDGKKNYEIIGLLETYYRHLKTDVKKKSGVVKSFSIYYETLADVIRTSRDGNDKMLRPMYLDSIYYAINFEDFRNLNEDGFGVDLHARGEWLRMSTARHLRLNMHDLLLGPVKDLRSELHKGSVEVHIPLPEEIEETEEEGADEDTSEEEAQAREEIENEEPAAPVAIEIEAEHTGENYAATEEEMISPPPLSPNVVRKSRDSHVLPINEGNITVTLIGNKPPSMFHKEDS